MNIRHRIISESKKYTSTEVLPLIDHAESVWFIEKDCVDIFLKTQLEDEKKEALWPVCRIEPDNILFDMTCARFIRTGDATSFYQLPMQDFLQYFFNEEWAEETKTLLVNYIKNSLSLQYTFRLAPQYSTPLQWGKQVLLEKQDSVSDLPFSWLKVHEGELSLCSVDGLLLKAGHIFPLIDGVWTHAVSAASVSLLKTAELTVEEVKASLIFFHAWLVYAWQYDCQTAAQLDKKLSLIRQRTDQKNLTNSFRALGDVLMSEIGEIASLTHDSPIVIAYGRIAQYKNLDLSALVHLSKVDENFPMLTVADLTRRTGLRFRHITFEGKWWLAGEPFLCFSKEGHHPFVLLPRRTTKKYDLFDPKTRKLKSFKPSQVNQFNEQGLVFYEPLPKESFKIKTLLQFGLSNTKRDFVRAGWMGLMAGILALIMPYSYSMLLDTIIPYQDIPGLFWLIALLVVFALMSAGFYFLRGLAILRVEGRADNRLQSGLWSRLFKLPLHFFTQYMTGDLAMRALGFFQIRALLSVTVVTSFFLLIFSVLYLIMMFYFNVPLSLTILLLFVGLMLMCLFLVKKAIVYTTKQFTLSGRLQGFVLQLLLGISKLRVMHAEKRAFSKWAIEYSEQQHNIYQSQLFINFIKSMQMAFIPLMSLVVFAAVAFFWQHAPDFSIGAFLTFNAAATALVLAFITMNSAALGVINIVPLYQRLLPILKAEPEVDEAKKSPGILLGKLSVQHLSFRYREEMPWVLKELAFDIQPGGLVAFVGYSGCGKSTLLRLLLGFEKPLNGSIYYDNQNLATLNVEEVRSQMGVVLQTSRLLPGSIFQNIVGAFPFTFDEAWEAACLCGLDKDIESMPMGMHTFVSEGAGTLSAGQRQLILIARAIINRPRILFFDEATSQLDSQAQALVSKALDGLNATRIVIAHRLSTVRYADKIFVMNEGGIVESGTYDALMEKKGFFAKLVRYQLLEENK